MSQVLVNTNADRIVWRLNEYLWYSVWINSVKVNPITTLRYALSLSLSLTLSLSLSLFVGIIFINIIRYYYIDLILLRLINFGQRVKRLYNEDIPYNIMIIVGKPIVWMLTGRQAQAHNIRRSVVPT